MLIVKVSAHLGDFTPRLRTHIGARYPYLAIPAVRYSQLDSELFCNIFYLRHLCDTQRFPDWPIPDPVRFLFYYSIFVISPDFQLILYLDRLNY